MLRINRARSFICHTPAGERFRVWPLAAGLAVPWSARRADSEASTERLCVLESNAMVLAPKFCLDYFDRSQLIRRVFVENVDRVLAMRPTFAIIGEAYQ
jgi:hypothetical protein